MIWGFFAFMCLVGNTLKRDLVCRKAKHWLSKIVYLMLKTFSPCHFKVTVDAVYW